MRLLLPVVLETPAGDLPARLKNDIAETGKTSGLTVIARWALATIAPAPAPSTTSSLTKYGRAPKSRQNVKPFLGTN